MAEIRIGDKTYSKISDVVKDYIETKKRLEALKVELKNSIKKLNRQLKKIVKFLNNNGLPVPQESEPIENKTELKSESKTDSGS